ncbi:uncharacterized protein RJT21DRAFT_46364 [Scheffersomyces amazonensis]|uniref:uncharacterized protein n=1 Tax=Scheffersomyces amazonensis TaxID=1078765 RepID=UPI00315D94C2
MEPIQPSIIPNTNINTTSSSCSPIVVKTSKQWVLPPRPKPGRKPVSNSHTSNSAATSTNTTNNSAPNSTSSNSHILDKKKKANVKKILPVIQPTGEGSSISSSSILSQSKLSTTVTSPCSVPTTPSHILANLNQNIKLIDSENISLKSHLLSLIHDYKQLRTLVLDNTSSYYNNSNVMKNSMPHNISNSAVTSTIDSDKNVHKRSYNEQQLIDNEFDNYITIPSKKMNVMDNNHDDDDEELLEEVDELDSDIEDVEDDPMTSSSSPANSASSSTRLSRTTSPYSDDFSESNSLMSTLTRSTTVSSSTSYLNDVKGLRSNSKLVDFPSFNPNAPSTYHFKFDELMNSSSTSSAPSMSDLINQDQYNMITDFLEEKLINNDVRYYVENNSNLENW